MSAKPSFVYFISCPLAGMVKIGYAKDPVRRFRGLQSMCPVPIDLMGFVAAQPSLERQLHTFFFDHHCRDEWFSLNAIVRAHIASLIDGTFDHSRLPANGTRAWALVRRAESAAA